MEEPARSEKKPTPYWNPYIAGIALGTVLFTAFLVTGSGLGASGGVARLVVQGLKLISPSMVNQNLYFAGMGGGHANPLDNRIVWMVFGAMAGGFVSGLFSGRLKAEICRGPHTSPGLRLVAAFTGGCLMGWGAAMARGCTSGQALSGGAVLSLGSWLFMLMIFAAGYASAYPLRRLWI